MNRERPPVLGFAAYSGTGKTTLIAKLIPLLRAQNLRLAVIKHAHHDFDVDYPAKDSFRLRKADSYQTLVSSAKRKVLITEFGDVQKEPTLAELIDDLDHQFIDLILVEGFKRERFSKIEVQRKALKKPCLYEDDSDIVALVTDDIESPVRQIPVLDINQPDSIARFICENRRRFRLNSNDHPFNYSQ